MSRARALPWLAVACAAIACYAATVGCALVQDDRQILTSPLLAHPFDVASVWSQGFLAPEFRHLALYRPLAQWTLLLNARANELLLGSAGSAAGFHAVNVLLHAAASLALLAWLRALPLRRGVPFAAALLFAVHPIHSEAVASVSARSEPLALALGLAFLLAHRRGSPALAALLYLAAMWSKESAAGWIAVVIAADLLFPEGSFALARRRWGAYAAVLAAWLGLRALALRGTAPEIAYLDNPAATASAFHRVLTAAAVQLDYLRLLVWPARQSVDYAFAHRRAVESAADPRALLFALVLAASLLAAIRFRRRAPVLALAVAGYAALFAATSNFLFPIGALEAERLAYMPSAFFCVLAGALLESTVRPLPRAVVLVILGLLTVRRSAVWKDEGTLCRSAVASAPGSAKAHLLLGRVLEEEGRPEPALREYEESARIYGDYATTWFFLGNLRHREGDAAGAIEAWRAALRSDPGLADVRANLASALLELARRPEALVEARELFARDPAHVRLPAIADALAAAATPEERAAAMAQVGASRAALRAGDPNAALARAQSAVISGALAREERRVVLLLLADCWSRLGREAGAQRFAEAARLLSAPGTPGDPAPR